MQVDFVRPGLESLEWLNRGVAELKDGAPLEPISIVVPNYVLGRFVTRHLARASGLVNVHAVRLADLAMSLLGGPAQVPRLLTTPMEMGAVRSALESSRAGLRGLAHHYPLYRELLKLFRELRRQGVGSTAIADIPRVSEAAAAAAATFDAFTRLTADYADTTIIRRLAADVLLSDREPATLREIGQILVYAPSRLDPVDAQLLTALARRVSVRVALLWLADPDVIGDDEARHSAELLTDRDPPTSDHDAPPRPATSTFALNGLLRVVRAPDPAEEVREMVRRIVANLEQGVPLPRQAILYRQTDPYAALVREVLTAGDLPWSALDGQSLSETLPGRALLTALRIGETDLAREAVLAWLTALPERGFGGGGHSSEWDRITRDANVVRGAEQWQRRLDLYASEIEHQAEQREREGSQAWGESLRSRAQRAHEIARSVMALSEAVMPPHSGSSWSEFVDWAETLRVRFASVDGAWPAPHDRACDLVRETLASLSDADRFPTQRPLSLADFLTTFEAALEVRSVPQGQLGVGVVVGPLESAVGFAFDRVYLLGLVEGVFPPSPAADPFFPDTTFDPLQRAARTRAADRHAFLAALSAVDDGEVVLGVPESAGGRAAFPSRWVLEVAGGLAGGPVLDAMRFRRLSESAHPWLRIVHSALDGLHRASVPADLDERRMTQAAAWRRAGRYLSTHALGLRPDLPLAASLACVRLRRSDQFTEFDGNLGALSQVARLQAFVDGSRMLSPTTLEVWATCPYHFFLESVLRVAPTQDPEEQWTIDAAEKGSLIHEVLARFFAELSTHDRPRAGEAYTLADFERLERIAQDRLRQIEAVGDAGHPLVWEATRRELLADLRTFLARDTDWRRAGGGKGGMVPTYFEKAFGDNQEWAAVEVPFEGGMLRVRGRMDRVDLSADGRRAQVFDYKTGSASRYKSLEPDPIEAGKKLQLAIYSRAVARALGESVRTGAAYWFISSRGEFKQIPLPDDPPAVARRLDDALQSIASGISTGVFPAVPGSDDYLEDYSSNCQWCPYDTVCPVSRDQDWLRKQHAGCESFISLSTLTVDDGADDSN
jgi:RecB family exonuclease